VLLLAVVAIVTLLQFFPALVLGPVVEKVLMSAGKVF
jgi:K+-transporting ATPase A subunit